MDRWQTSKEERIDKWKTNFRAMQNRIKDRVRVVVCSSAMRGSLRQGHMPSLNSSTALRATATGLAVARVFKGNVILARLVHSKTKQEWANRMSKFAAYFPNIPILVSASAVSAAACAEPAYNDSVAGGLPLPATRHPSLQSQHDRGSEIDRLKPDHDFGGAEDSSMLRILQAVAVPLLGNVCHAFMHGLNFTEVYGAEKLHQAIENRPKGQPLITGILHRVEFDMKRKKRDYSNRAYKVGGNMHEKVSNHVASVDDPFVISSVLPPRLLLDASSLRWTLCATDRCFTNAVASAFFRCVKVLPVARGEGIHQKGMDMALSKLNKGNWVHIFPEGSRSRDGGRTIGTAKRGVGRLVLDAEKMPLVIPFVHTGMEEVMPIGSQLPHMSKKVAVLIGDPIKVDDLFMASSEQGLSKGMLYDAISLRVGERLQELKKELDELVLKQSLQIKKTYHAHAIERVNGIVRFVDWEAYDLLCHELLEEDSPEAPCLGQETRVGPVAQGSDVCIDLKGSPTMTIHQQAEGLKNDDGKEYICANYIGLQGGIISRLQGFMDPSVLMGFAARGLLVNGKSKLDNLHTFCIWRYKAFNGIGLMLN